MYNGTLNVNSSRNGTTSGLTHQAYYIARTSANAAIAALILSGNSFCLAVFLKNRALRGRPYYLLINLCIADLLVGVSVFLRMLEHMDWLLQLDVPLSVKYFGYTLDYFSNLVSVYLLAAISIERLIAIVFPFYIRYSGIWMYVVLIGSPWVITVACTVVYIVTYRFPMPLISIFDFDVFYLICIYVPVVLIFVCYCVIAIRIKCTRFQGNNQSQRLRDKKLAVTLLIVTLASIVTWDPYTIYYTLTYHCNICGIPLQWDVFHGLLMLQYCNSFINVVVYMFRIREFRRILPSFKCGHRQPTHIRGGVRVHPETLVTRL